MHIIIFSAIVFSAILHVSWNSLGKFSKSAGVTHLFCGIIFLLVGIAGIISLHAWHPPKLLLFIAAMHAFIESVYFLILKIMHKLGSFSLGYPISRATSIIFVTCFSFLNSQWRISLPQIGLIIAIAVLMIFMVYQKNIDISRRALVYFIFCAFIIACYTTLGAWGVNLGKGSFVYSVWMYFFQGILMMLIAWHMIHTEQPHFIRNDIIIGLLVGIISLSAFSIILWAQTQTQPALVSALREMGIIFSLPVARILFKEKVSRTQYLIAGGILCCNISLALISPAG